MADILGALSPYVESFFCTYSLRKQPIFHDATIGFTSK